MKKYVLLLALVAFVGSVQASRRAKLADGAALVNLKTVRFDWDDLIISFEYTAEERAEVVNSSAQIAAMVKKARLELKVEEAQENQRKRVLAHIEQGESKPAKRTKKDHRIVNNEGDVEVDHRLAGDYGLRYVALFNAANKAGQAKREAALRGQKLHGLRDSFGC